MMWTIARLVRFGNAAKRMPSSANTRPSATRKSDINPKPCFSPAPSAARSTEHHLGALPGRSGSRRATVPPARRIDEIAEELRIRPQQHARVVVLHAGFVGLHRAVEGEEVGVLAIGLGEDVVALAVALAADLLGFRGRLGKDDG